MHLMQRPRAGRQDAASRPSFGGAGRRAGHDAPAGWRDGSNAARDSERVGGAAPGPTSAGLAGPLQPIGYHDAIGDEARRSGALTAPAIRGSAADSLYAPSTRRRCQR